MLISSEPCKVVGGCKGRWIIEGGYIGCVHCMIILCGMVMWRVCSDDGGKFVMCNGDGESLRRCEIVTMG